MLESSGEITPPCGVPESIARSSPSSTTPAWSHCRSSLSTRLAEGLQRLRRAAPGPEAVGGRTKVRLEDRLQHQLRSHLHHPVPDRRDAQRPLLSVGLRDVPAQHRGCPVRACSQRGAELFQEALDPVLLDVGDRLGIDARRASAPLHPLPRFREDVTPRDAVVQRVEPATRAPLGREPQSALELSHFVDRPRPTGVVGTGLAGHALALTSAYDVTTAGTLPSRRVVRRGDRRYYDPLGLPLRSARFHLRLIRATSPRRRRRRRASRVPPRSLVACCAPYPAGTPHALRLQRAGRRLRRDVSGSAPGLFLCRGCRLHLTLRPATLLPP